MTALPDGVDVVVVGGRVAGASLAAHLGTRGVRVLLVDKAVFPSLPAVPSSPIIHPGTMALLDALGIPDQAYLHPDGRIERFMLQVGDHFHALMDIPSMAGRAHMQGVSRQVLDHVLWEHAGKNSSVTRVEQCSFRDVVRDAQGRVQAVVLALRDGSQHRVATRVLVGADGRFSPVARKVGAPVVLEKPDHCSTVFYADWTNVAPVTPRGNCAHVFTTARGTDVLFFPMPDGKTSVNTHQRADRVDVQGDATAYYLQVVQQFPAVARRLAQATRVTDVVGVKHIANGYRKSAGPGWVLLGDALHFKDPVDGQGIYDALLESQALAGALHGWLTQSVTWDAAVAAYDRAVRDGTLPMFESTTQRLKRELYQEPPVPVIRTVLRWMLTDAEYQDRFLRVLGRQRTAEGWLSPGLVLGCLWRGLARDLRGKRQQDAVPQG